MGSGVTPTSGCFRPAVGCREGAGFKSACFVCVSARGAEVNGCSCTGLCNSAGEDLKQRVARL